MRILHSSDWHLGQHFMGKSREMEHRAFLDWLLQQIEQHQVDALIVAGDIFDTGSPPSYARRLYNQFIVEMQQTGCQFVVLGGNHDSVAVLHESRALLACLGTQVIGGALENSTDQVVELNKRDGSVGAILCAVPFLRPRDMLVSQAGESGDAKQLQLMQAMKQHYSELYESADKHRQEIEKDHKLPIIATGHLTTVGGKTSDSVRDIYIGTLDAFPASAFPPADYIALGHLHRAQIVGGHEHIRYSGSPIPLSFDEANSEKKVLLVEFSQGKLSDTTSLTVPRNQPLAVIKANLEQLPEALKKLVEQQQLLRQESVLSLSIEAAEPADPVPDIWLEIEVQSDDYLKDLQSRVEAITADFPVEVLRIRRARSTAIQGLATNKHETLAELTVNDVFSRRLAQESLEPGVQQQLEQAFKQVVSELEQNESPDELAPASQVQGAMI